MDYEDFIKLPDFKSETKEYLLTKNEIKYINRGYQSYEPTELQIK